ncbi:protein FAM8A1 [Diabrotica virgifera virgifera]|uniref:RDD domain-containing protein n=1 Tax=Diabrotica virgifera virgifera TaxID=50390 RepID=A0ABM5LAW8_DIAVI|nr:protein FAM8A1 [Diabrotica virgifera virgifera]
MDDINTISKDQEDYEQLMQKEKKEREEYIEKLKKWLDEARLWHYNVCAGFSYNLGNVRENSFQQFVNPFANLQPQNQPNVLRQRVGFTPNGNYQQPLFQAARQPAQNNQPPPIYEFIIPPLWKRAAAELMDFLLLLLLKVALTFLLLESFDIIDTGYYGLELFHKNLENSDGTVPMAFELLTLELVHRLIVCGYEAYFMQGKFLATPGKRYMGLMVISVQTITPIPSRPTETVSVTNAAPLSWQKSLTRSTLKNLLVGLFLPICIFYIFPQNRTCYDMMSKSLVVEYHPDFMSYHSNL